MATGRVQQDTFMDDSDDACPLCVEEFDLSDKNFRPCPCGYQVCQFCYNNIKTNMNGLCPACRRPYDEKNIEWKIVSPEEFKADVALQARKKAAARQKEAERRQAESSSRKNLAGLRVVQKNLVYVVGLNPRIREEDLLQTLRGDQYFGQYGKIIKIVVSKAKEGSGGSQSIGVYVTFARKQDAASCIAAVDGSQNGDRVLRAQYGTTKYCSAYLRNEVCNNKGCMFLHETGEDNDSFSRQDLSSMNAVSTQRPAASSTIATSSTKPAQQPSPPQPQPPPQQALPVLSAVSQTMARHTSKDGTMSRSDSGDGSALPTTATWVKNPHIQQSRRSSHGASQSSPSPRTSTAKLLATSTENRQAADPSPSLAENSAQANIQESPISLEETAKTITISQDQHSSLLGLERAVKTVRNSSFKWTLDRTMYDDEILNIIDNYPPLIDVNGGAIHYAMKSQREEEQLNEEEKQRNMLQAMSTVEDDDNLASGSLQLGGEPETQDHQTDVVGRLGSVQRDILQQRSFGIPGQPFDGQVSMANNFADMTLGARSLTPQQQHHISLLKSNNPQHEAVHEHLQRGITSHSSLHQPQLSNPFQAQNQQLSALSGHVRQASRYTFANDSASASAIVKPATSAQLMAQQSAMMPPQLSKPFTSQPSQPPNLRTNFYSGVQGPPPGLKSSGTPPISGGGMFGQGHGFASAMGGSLGLGGSNFGGKNSNDDLMRDFLRGRSGIGNGLGTDVGKREFTFPSFLPKRATSTTSPAPGLQSSLYGPPLGAYNGHQDQGHLKQKKKGKKHRHANTSSSGGGGIVDLADPSILQARVHHGVAGQGQYGGTQGQGSRDPNAIESSENAISETHTTPAILPTKEELPRIPAAATISTPPGFSSTEDFPPLATPQKLASTSKAISSTITPVTPLKPSVNQVLLADQRPPIQDSSAVQKFSGKAKPEAVTNDNVGSATKGITNDDNEPLQSRPNDENDVSRATLVSQDTDEIHVRESETAITTHDDKLPKKTEKKPSLPEKRQRPGKLDITAAKDASKRHVEQMMSSVDPVITVTPSKSVRNNMSGSSQPGTPGIAFSQSSASPLHRQAPPRIIRVVQTPKPEATRVETPPRQPSLATTVSTPVGMTNRRLSRQPSLNSLYQPDTPANDTVSDNMSLTSTSLSRPGSPPIGKVGSAPVRLNTKSQQKKERQARARNIEDSRQTTESTTFSTLHNEPVQAPIVGRKKKTKKSKLQMSTDSLATGSGLPSTYRHDEPTQDHANTAITVDPREGRPASSSRKRAKHENNEKVVEEELSEIAPETPNELMDKSRKNQLSAAAIFAELQKAGEIVSSALDLFRNVTGVNHRFELDEIDLSETDRVPPISDAQRRLLDQGKSICIKLTTNKYAVVLPNRRVLRGFSQEQAERYRNLRSQTLQANGPADFHSNRHSIERWLNSDLPQAIGFNGESAVTKLPNGEHATMPGEIAPLFHDRFAAASPRDKQVDVPLEKFWEVDTTMDTASIGGGQNRQPSMTAHEAERALTAARKETEALEKRLNGLLKKNRKLLMSIH
ncbi:transcriptional repressor general negative regulator of transcription subunit 4 [Xylographa opegraphella]|nr:transcriptional repressor general negative regulator of transcription subunit 4 [Xylographa opegraphella]